MQKYTIEQLGEFFEVFNWEDKQTEFVSESRPAALHALTCLRNKGEIEHRLLQPDIKGGTLWQTNSTN